MFFSHGLCLMFLALALTIAPETKMSQNPRFNRPPKRAQTQSGNTTPISAPSTPLRTPNEGPSVQNSPGNPLAFVPGHRRYRSGYEVQPKATPYKPYALNNPGTPTQGAFNLSKETSLEAINALDPWQYTELAVKAKLLPPDCAVHSFQVETSNIVLMRRTDTVVIAPTGYGKSLTWTLPLLACREGISLVITPFTSLGQEGELLSQTDDISSLFIYGEQNSQQDFEAAASGEMMVLYVCPEMLESPSFARLLHSKSWRGRILAIYLDEAHLVHQTHSWRPSYSRIYQLRNILGNNIPLICLSATCPPLYRNSLITYAGLHPDYKLINLGNFRPELSTMIVHMKHEIRSFNDIAFILPLGCLVSNLNKTIVYCDDIELLTEMFWWAYYRAAHIGLPTEVVDIVHSGLSARGQVIPIEQFRNGKTKILFSTSKISAGMNFPDVEIVIQYKCRDLTIADFDQRRGRGARSKDRLAVGIIFVEPSMWPGEISIENPGDQDPGMVELVQSTGCAEEIIQRHLGNPPHFRPLNLNCCNRCDPTYHPPKEYRWIAFEPTQPSVTVKTTGIQREIIFNKLTEWCLEHWRTAWKDDWPSYGPKSIISDADLENVSKHTSKIFSADDLKKYSHIVHWEVISVRK
ncbi:P-loop containing nucleoside triphosphate hydrolase protein [Mycena olivaceomarginata]|nr:P-loop containing nucleoside triphosphate hydrolase protein [Mycena olivaceomarginata]